MGFSLKMFDSLGTITLVTSPSMTNPENLTFTLVNLQEKEKNEFAMQLNKIFPNDNITVFIYDQMASKNWLQQAMDRSNHVLMEKAKAPIWIDEMCPEGKIHYISEEQSVAETFEIIRKEKEV